MVLISNLRKGLEPNHNPKQQQLGRNRTWASRPAHTCRTGCPVPEDPVQGPNPPEYDGPKEPVGPDREQQVTAQDAMSEYSDESEESMNWSDEEEVNEMEPQLHFLGRTTRSGRVVRFNHRYM